MSSSNKYKQLQLKILPILNTESVCEYVKYVGFFLQKYSTVHLKGTDFHSPICTKELVSYTFIQYFTVQCHPVNTCGSNRVGHWAGRAHTLLVNRPHQEHVRHVGLKAVHRVALCDHVTTRYHPTLHKIIRVIL